MRKYQFKEPKESMINMLVQDYDLLFLKSNVSI